MADGYSTENSEVAATFAALELTKLIMDRLHRGDLMQEIKDVDQIFKGVYASTRAAQIERQRSRTSEGLGACSCSSVPAVDESAMPEALRAAWA